jgi:hypothetical protein
MRRLFLMAMVALGALALGPTGALGAGPDEQFRDVGTEVDRDFCGTHQKINIAFDVRVNLWILPEDPRDYSKLTQSGKVTFTNPKNGTTVVLSFSGLTTNTIVEGDPLGVHTHSYSTRGLAEKIQMSGGRVLTRDAGLINELLTFDASGNVIAYEATWKGPHPEAASDFTLFCEVMTEALGI